MMYEDLPMLDPVDQKIVWVDLEMTGLNLETDTIMEVACCVTDFKLDTVIEGPSFAIKTPERKLLTMGRWCRKHHRKSGLIDSCRLSEINIEEAEFHLLSFVRNHVVSGTAPVAGCSVYLDRRWLMKFMPDFNSYMHPKIIDVSSIREMCKRWAPHVVQNEPKKILAHRALDDILESINLLKYYRAQLF